MLKVETKDGIYFKTPVNQSYACQSPVVIKFKTTAGQGAYADRDWTITFTNTRLQLKDEENTDSKFSKSRFLNTLSSGYVY